MNWKKLATLCVVGAAMCASSAYAIGPVDIEITADYASAYIWRGQDLNADNGDAFQPGGSVSISPIDGLSLGGSIWASMETDVTGKFTEIDYTLDAAFEVGMLTISAGHIYYFFPTASGPDFSDANDTAEVYAGLGVALPQGIGLSVTAYYDYDDGEGMYILCGADYGTSIADGIDLSLGLSAGYGNYDDDGYMGGYDGISDINASAGLSVDLGGGLGLGTSLNYTYIPDAKDEINSTDEGEIWLMTGLAYAF